MASVTFASRLLYATKKISGGSIFVKSTFNPRSVAIRSYASSKYSRNVRTQTDFYGIYENEINTPSFIDQNENYEKVDEIEDLNTQKLQDSRLRQSEKVIPAMYGLIRRDKDNTLMSKRQLRKSKFNDKQIAMQQNTSLSDDPDRTEDTDTEIKSAMNEPKNCDYNYFDEMLIKDYNERQPKVERTELGDVPNTDNHSNLNFATHDTENMNLIDRQYFGRNRQPESDQLPFEMSHNYCDNTNIKTTESVPDNIKEREICDNEAILNLNENTSESDISTNMTGFNFIDDQYFNKSNLSSYSSSDDMDIEMNLNKSFDTQYIQESTNNLPSLKEIHHDTSVGLNTPNNFQSIYSPSTQQFQPSDTDHTVPHYVHSPTHKHHKAKKISERSSIFHESEANINDPKSAFDMVMKMRSEKLTRKSDPSQNAVDPKHVPGKGERLDSRGFRIMRDHITDFSKMPRSEIVDMLQEAIIYDQHDIVAINKPYGLPSHGGPGVVASLGQLLPDLSLRVDRSGDTQLCLIHRLDKETTGVVVLARTAEVAAKLRAMFHARTVVKKYWVITKDVPSPSKGIIDIPLIESKVGTGYRITVKPRYSEDTKSVMTKSRVRGSDAVTNYTVLDATSYSALVECLPETGKKHQIRVHLSQGLNTPILGDHKYSHSIKLAPQRLSPTMLQQLGIRQAKVRDVPMHLHAHTLILPQFIDGKNIKITVKPPRYFLKNMDRLKLKNPFIALVGRIDA